MLIKLAAALRLRETGLSVAVITALRERQVDPVTRRGLLAV